MALILKVALYWATCGLIGGLFSLWFLRQFLPLRGQLVRYIRRSALVLAVASFGLFLLAGDSVNWSSLSDPQGQVLQWRLMAVLGILIGLMTDPFRAGYSRFSRPAIAAASIALLVSFVPAGHTQKEGLAEQTALLLHLMAVGVWVGSLLPLYWLTASLEDRRQECVDRLRTFGQLGNSLVLVLLIGGFWMLLRLPDGQNPLDTTWGGSLLFKMALVALMLALAAQNKFRLVPALAAGEPAAAFRMTLIFELVFAFLILVITAAVTSYTTPF